MRLCLTLAEETPQKLSRKLALYAPQVARIEVRLDYLPVGALPVLPTGDCEYVATCRPKREGGRYRGEEQERLAWLREAAQAGFDWVDLEHDVELQLKGTRIIRSLHRFDQPLPDLNLLFERLKSKGGDLLKLAVQVTTTEELVRLLGWMAEQRGPRCIIGMGEQGQPSRFLGAFLGNEWTYVGERKGIAPGQLSLAEARLLGLPEWTEPPRLYGVMGNPVGHSLSPKLHNQLFRESKLACAFLPLPLTSLKPWFTYLDSTPLEFGGFSVTLPFKREVIGYVEAAEESLNTISMEGNRRRGVNTDRDGFLIPLKSLIQLQEATALVLGHGGVAETVVGVLREEGTKVTVVGRNRDRLTRFARRHKCPFLLFEDLPCRADLCVNTTPVGQYPEVERSPLEPDCLQFDLVYDLVYNPEVTRLLLLAQNRGIRVLSGLEMFVEQAARQFQLWTGVDPERSHLREIVREGLAAVPS